MGLTDAQRRRYAIGMIFDHPTKSPDQVILETIEAFLVEKGISAATFGIYTVGDGKIVDRLRGGGTISVRTFDVLRRSMQDWDAAKAKFLAANAERRARPKPKPATKGRRKA